MDEIFTADLKRRIKDLFEQCEDLIKENTELKKKLKTAPPKGATVREKQYGTIYYSFGELASTGSLLATRRWNQDRADCSISNWEEIEVKVKGA